MSIYIEFSRKSVAYVLGGDEQIVHEIVQRRLGGHIMERVGSLERLVLRMMHDGRWQMIEARKISNNAIVLDDE